MMKSMKIAVSVAALVGVLGSLAVAAPAPIHVIALQNGWVGGPYSTRLPSYYVDADFSIHLRGALYQTSGSNNQFATLPVDARPIKDTYIAVDLTNAHTGRIYIKKTGEVYALTLTGEESEAQGFLSLDGIVYSKR